MSYATSRYDEVPCIRLRSGRRVPPELVVSTIGLLFTVAAIAWLLHDRPAAAPIAAIAAIPAPVVTASLAPMVAPVASDAVVRVPRIVAAAMPADPLLDPSFALGYASLPLAQSAPLAAAFQRSETSPTMVVAAQDDPASAAPPADAAPLVLAPAPQPVPVPVAAPRDMAAAEPETAEIIPFPTPRPPEFDDTPSAGPVSPPSRPAFRMTRPTVAAAAPPDNRSFFDKLFGTQPQPQPKGLALAYAAPETGSYGRAGEASAYGRASDSSAFGRAPSATSNAMISPDRFTAVYDIAAHTVYMPDGTRLEAHSGLGDKLDDPRHVMERNRGATPPNVYELQPREQLFHGVRALRLNPVGSSSVFGRTGLLAHSYMLGPHGDSNGCVSFRNYDAFLEAFSKGSVRRLAVVARSS